MTEFDMNTIAAADNLVGKNIGGWTVINKFPAADLSKGETGGTFSICYSVEREGKIYFMKVLDYKRAFMQRLKPGQSRAEVTGRYLLEFNYEKDLSNYCNSKKVSKIIRYIDSGEIEIEGYFISTVSYIVYEMANGNIRSFLDFSEKIDEASILKTLVEKLKSLHDVATGLNSLHSIHVSHQDIKPSNVMIFSSLESKLGDLGRSLCFSPEIKCPYTFNHFLGDLNYAPPEALFGFEIANLRERHYQADNYMLGGLVVFYLTSISMNAWLELYLPAPMRDLYAQGIDFSRILPCLLDAFQHALIEIRKIIKVSSIRDMLIQMITYLCNPDPRRRGHPVNLVETSKTSNWDLYRTISELDLMYRRAKLELSQLK